MRIRLDSRSLDALHRKAIASKLRLDGMASREEVAAWMNRVLDNAIESVCDEYIENNREAELERARRELSEAQQRVALLEGNNTLTV